METFLTIIIVVLSAIGTTVSIHFLCDTIFKSIDARKDHRKKHMDDLDKIIEQLDDIIRILQR